MNLNILPDFLVAMLLVVTVGAFANLESKVQLTHEESDVVVELYAQLSFGENADHSPLDLKINSAVISGEDIIGISLTRLTLLTDEAKVNLGFYSNAKRDKKLHITKFDIVFDEAIGGYQSCTVQAIKEISGQSELSIEVGEYDCFGYVPGTGKGNSHKFVPFAKLAINKFQYTVTPHIEPAPENSS